VFPNGQDPVSQYVEPRYSVTFDLTRDQPENQLTNEQGSVTYRLGSFAKTFGGRAVVRLYSDLKRHDMGAGLAEAIDETGHGASVFITRPLWGVGSTAPYLHDGRAATIEEATLAHGGEALASRTRFAALPPTRQQDVAAYLKNEVLFKSGDDDGLRRLSSTRR
jgi:hypothetical protein